MYNMLRLWLCVASSASSMLHLHGTSGSAFIFYSHKYGGCSISICYSILHILLISGVSSLHSFSSLPLLLKHD
ncbi:hypothetical protein BDV10DRAFT_546 [Aspergillus recurvatus]